MAYVPTTGEIIWTRFDPALGREQTGRRPALVVSVSSFSEGTGMAIVCPITSRIRPFPSSVVLPPAFQITGEILISHMRSIDLLARPVHPIGAFAPADTMEQVKTKLRSLLDV